MKKRILFIVSLPPPVHGTTLMNQFVVNSRLLNSEFICSFLSLNFADSINDIGIFRFGKIWKMLTFSIKLIRCLIRIRPHLVYFTIAPVGGAFYRDAFFSLLIRILNSRVLYHLHGKGIANSSNSFIKRIIYRLTFKNSDVIVLAGSLISDISSIYSGRPFILANGLPKFFFERKETLSEPPTILFLSNLIRSKGIEIFLECIKQLNESGVSFKAKIVGAPYDISFEEVAKFLKDNSLLKKVKILGPLFGIEKEKVLSTSDLLLFPSYYQNEAFPITILEAMQAGVPVIASNNGAIAEIIENEKTGFIVPMHNISELKAKSELLIRNPSLRSQMAIAAKERFDRLYTIEIFERNIFGIFKQILK
jgi:glycosyltransferase involved in cell wall biosynthesis